MRRILIALCVVVACGLSSKAQEAQLTGLITDPTGAVVPQATVALRSQDTGVKSKTESNSAGIYTFPFVKPGPYDATVEKPGFKTLNSANIKLDVKQNARIDFTLEVGATTQMVEVKGVAPLVNKSDATVSDVITGSQVVNLNLNGRNVLSLTMLVPGAAPQNSFSPGHVGYGNSSFNVIFNGGRYADSNVEVDGANNADEGAGGRTIVSFPNIDSISEFRITTSNYGADTGRRPGVVVEVVTKGGTKDFHGTAYEFLRNDSLDANNFFLNRQINPPGGKAFKQPLKWNLFGYNLGGPFYIPGHYNTDKSKTFLFWSEGWARYREGKVLSAGVPTLRMRQGDFSECVVNGPNYNSAAASGCVVPTDPATGLPMPTLAGARYSIDPNGAAILNGLFPLPNNTVDGYVAALSLPTSWRQENIRLDQNIGQRTRMFVRYTQDANFGMSTASYDSVLYVRHTPTKNAAINISTNLKSNMMNEFVIGVANNWRHLASNAGSPSPAHSILKPSTWTAQALFPANVTNPAGATLPAVSVSGGIPFSASVNTAQNPATGHMATTTLKDNVSYSLGKHTLKFGVYVLDYHCFGYNSSDAPQGSFAFDASGPLTTGNALADMYLGRIQSYTEGTPFVGGFASGGWGIERWRVKDFEPYFQDDWKVSRKLTLNLGLRWQFHGPWHDVSQPTIDSDFIPSMYNPANEAQLDPKGLLIPGTGHIYTSYGNGLVQCGSGGIPVGCVYNYYGAWAPRLGFAYDPTGSGKTAIRGGYGVFYDMGYGDSPNDLGWAGGPPTVVASTATDINGYQNLLPGQRGPNSFTAGPLHVKTPMDQQFNLTVQHEFSVNSVLSVAYVGMLGRRLGRGMNINQVPLNSGTMNAPGLAGTTGCDASGNCNVQSVLIHTQHPNIYFVPYRGYGRIQYLDDTAVVNYHSLQVNYRHAVGHGLTFQSAYTWEHAIDDSTQEYYLSGVDDLNKLSRWRGNSDNNRTQILQLNYIYDIPFFRNSASHFVRNGLGGWQLSGITSFFSGPPVDFRCTERGYGTGIGTSARCNTLGPLNITKGVTNDSRFGPVATWFNPSMIAMANLSQYNADGASGMFGYMGRNILTGPGRNNWDMALFKNFTLPWIKGEHSTLQFRWETFNTFNHTQWKTVQAGCGSTTPFGSACTGAATNLGNGEVNSAWDPRQMQFGLKFLF